MPGFHQLERRGEHWPQGNGRLPPGSAAAVIVGLSALSWAVLVLLSAVYELPIGPGKKFLNSNRAVNRIVVGGWQISGVAGYSSGTPFGISRGGSPVLAGGNRANLVPGQPFSLNWNNYKEMKDFRILDDEFFCRIQLTG